MRFILFQRRKEKIKKDVRKEDSSHRPLLYFMDLPISSLIKQGDLYFYQKTYYVLWNCIPEKNPLPEFINLQPKDLVKLPINSVQAFLKENILKKINDKRGLLIVASQLDTLKNEGFFNITHFLNDNKITLYLIRRTTQEEDVVLEYKESDLFYNSDSVQWNKSRIKFFDSK